MAKLLDKGWERMQKKTFTKWVNMHLAKRGDKCEDLLTAFEDGNRLSKLLNVLTGDTVKTRAVCRMKIQKTENIQKCLDYIQNDKGVRLLNIDASNIFEGNLMLTLALVWMLILHLDVDEMSAEELNAKAALLLWCQKKTSGYKHVDPPGIKNFHKSWKDGMAFCALIHKHKPGLIDYDSLDPNNDAENLEKAFAAAESLGIMRFLDVEDMVENERPDEKSVMTYLFQWYKYFAAGNKSETAARRIAKLVALTKQLDALKDEYNVKSAAWAAWTRAKTDELANLIPANSLEGVKSTLSVFNAYKNNEKPPKAGEKTELEVSLNNIQLKLRNAGRPAFVPADGHTAADIRKLWADLVDTEGDCYSLLKAELKRQKKLADLVKRFNRLANKLDQFATAKTAYLDAPENIDTLNAAKSKLQLHQGFFSDLELSDRSLTKAVALAAQIDELNYAEKDEVNARAAGLTSASDQLKSSGDAKQQRLEEAVAREERKNELRKEYAGVAKETETYYKAETVAVATSGFGNTLAAVTAFKATLDADAARITGEADGKKAALVAKDAELNDAGITSNEYSVITVADIEGAHQQLLAKLQARQANYEQELAHQTALDNKRKEFAVAAQALSDLLSEKQAAVDATEGSEDDKIAATEAIANDSGVQAQLGAVKALDDEIKAMLTGTTNEHSAFTVADLSRMVDTFNTRAQNAIETCKQNKQYAARNAEQEAARNAQAAAERASVEFATQANHTSNWLDTVEDNIGDDVSHTESLEAVEAQEALYNQSQGELAGEQAKLDALVSLAAGMAAAGNADFGTLSLESVQAKWDTTTGALSERRTALDQAKAQQASDEALRAAFVSAATAFNEFLQKQEAAVAAEASGELEQQLDAANALMVTRNSEGAEKLQVTVAASQALAEAHVSADERTDLTADALALELDQLTDAIKTKVAAIQAEIAAKSDSQIPAEKVAEFREVFAHFDSNQNGVLSHLEFTGCLKSLGEDRSDADFAQICANVDKSGNGEIEFDEFLEFMISVTEDKDTESEIVQAFEVLTGGADFVTEDQIRSVMEADTVEYLLANMPKTEHGYDYKSFTAKAYGA